MRGDQCYRFEHIRQPTAFDAYFQCIQAEGSAAIIRTEEELLWVRDIVQTAGDNVDPYIGLYYNPVSRNFLWVDETPLTVESWADDTLRGSLTCVVTTDSLDGDAWRTVGCSENRPYICQKPAGWIRRIS